jgi:glycosyltransferase involved in cell wall biosynthesis
VAHDPLVSIVIPCYRQAYYLPDALASAFDQTYPAIEVIVVNDGSDDDTAEVARRFGDKIRYVYQSNSGLSAARNHGIRLAGGEWIQFLDADDRLSPEKISNQIMATSSRPDVDIVYSGYWCFSDDRPGERWTYLNCELGKDPFLSFVRDWDKNVIIPHHGLLFKKTCIDRWGTYDTKLPNHEDWDLLIRYAAGGAIFYYLPDQTAWYRLTPQSMSRGKESVEIMKRGKYACLEKHLSNALITRRQRQVIRRQYVSERAGEIWEARFSGFRSAANAARPMIAYGTIPSRGLLRAWGGVSAKLAYQILAAVGRKAMRLYSPKGSVGRRERGS